MAGDTLDLLGFCLDNQQLGRVLIYDGQSASLPPIPACEQQKVQVSHAVLPDLASLQRLMVITDPQRPLIGTVISVR
jgi:hypothetical protein